MDQATLISFLSQQSKNQLFIVAIEGLCGSGKSLLAQKLHQLCGGILIHMDDFCVPKELRRDEIAGHIDFQRLKDEVLNPLTNHQDIQYRRFDCHSQSYMNMNQDFQNLVIVEGSYSMHPQLTKYYDFSIFVEVDESLRIKRLQMREQERFEMFMKVWQQKELAYHQAYQIRSQCDVIIKDEKSLSICDC